MALFIVQTAVRVHDGISVKVSVWRIVCFVISNRKFVAELEILETVRKSYTALECITVRTLHNTLDVVVREVNTI